jgi:hypothetical protein
MDGKKPSYVRMFVRIGALKRFHFLKQKTANLPVSVEWDRRREERRSGTDDASADLRKGERRATPPYTWETADFVVVEETAEPVGSDRKKSD